MLAKLAKDAMPITVRSGRLHRSISPCKPLLAYRVGMYDEAANAIIAKQKLLHLKCADAAGSTPQPYLDGYRQPVCAGWIIGSLAFGAHLISHVFYAHWLQLGGATGFLGFPITDELTTAIGNGRFCDFQGGSIYGSAASGVASIQGAIRDYWATLGGVGSDLGFPIGEEQLGSVGLTVVQQFVGGMVLWCQKDGEIDHVLVGRLEIDRSLRSSPDHVDCIPRSGRSP